MPKYDTSRFSSVSTLDLPKEVREPLGFSFSARKYKTILLLVRYPQGIVNTCFQITWGHVLEWRVNYRLAMPALKIETRWIKPSPSQESTVLGRRERHSNASELSQRTAKQWRGTSAVLLVISFLASYSNIIQPVLFWTRSMSLVKCQSTVTAQRLHFRDGVNVTAIILEFQEKPLKSLLWWDYYRAIMMQECNTTAILIKVYGSQGQCIIM